jgi:hypothetical protein
VMPKFFQLNRFIFDCIFWILLIIIIIGSKIYTKENLILGFK